MTLARVNVSCFFENWCQERPVRHFGSEAGKGRQKEKVASSRSSHSGHLGLSSFGGQQRTCIHQFLDRATSFKSIIFPDILPTPHSWGLGTEEETTHNSYCQEYSLVGAHIVQLLQDTYIHSFTHIHTCTSTLATQLHTQSHLHTHCVHKDTQKQNYIHLCALTIAFTLLGTPKSYVQQHTCSYVHIHICIYPCRRLNAYTHIHIP